MTFINLCPSKDIFNIFICDVEMLIIFEFMLKSLDLLTTIRLVKTCIKRIKSIGKLCIVSCGKRWLLLLCFWVPAIVFIQDQAEQMLFSAIFFFQV